MSGKIKDRNFYTSWLSSIVHMVVVPLFAFVFMIIYRPFGVSEYLHTANASYSFNITILFCFLLCVMIVTRLLLLLFRERVPASRKLYALWCVAEVVIASLFMSMYISLVMGPDMYRFYDVAQKTIASLFCICVYPYLLLYFGLDTYMQSKDDVVAEDQASLVRFYDEYKKLKFIISAEAILYIKSEDNYVQVHYTDNKRAKKQMLRSSMRALEDTLSQHGLVRCHRSYYVNPSHVKMLHKDSSGMLLAALDHDGLADIPISRKYQDVMMRLL